MGPVVHPKQLEMTFYKGYSYVYKEIQSLRFSRELGKFKRVV
jgi:hypothetical protein